MRIFLYIVSASFTGEIKLCPLMYTPKKFSFNDRL
jgi:hypothetical protein